MNRRLVHGGRAAGLRGAAVAIGTVLVLAGCSGGSSTAAPATSSPPPPTTTATPTTATPTSSTTTPAATPSTTLPTALGQVITVSYANGKVVGPGGRVKVKQNSTVQISVTSDVADQVHLHGYDKSVDVAAGGTVVLNFKATLTGVFEVELEGKKQPLLKLQVS